MQALFEMSEGRRRLAAILANHPEDSAHWSEAQNRFQFVDRLLMECLGWSHPFVNVEEQDGAGGRADYVLGVPAKAVLEAKREAIHFKDLPVGKPSLVRKLAPLLENCKALKDAVLQAIGYCALKGAPIAIVCNGPQLVIFQALTPLHSPLEGECYLFNGLKTYYEEFPTLWSLLSPEGVHENFAQREISQFRNPRIPPKASTAIIEPTRFRYRNAFQETLRSLAAVLLDDLETNPDIKARFYKECYVPIEANNRHLLLSKKLIASRYLRSAQSGVAPVEIGKTISTDRKGKIRLSESVQAAASGSRPIVVIGDVGVGKTSFFENLYETLDDKGRSNTYFLHIDLGTKATLSDSIKDHVLSSIPAILREKYAVNLSDLDLVTEVYRRDLVDFDQGVFGPLKAVDNAAYQKERSAFLGQKISNRAEHIHASLAHLAKSRSKEIIIVIDNADQRNFEAQQEAFLIAQELAATRVMLVFVAVRPSTFHRSKLTGALSGYQNQVLAISPPPPVDVIQKRIVFAVRVAEGKAVSTLKDIRLQVSSVISFMNVVLRSIQTNDSIRLFLNNITGGNIRLVVELVTAFCGSPNVDSRKIVEIEEREGKYVIPLHEFTKHALLGEYAYYNPHSSLVGFNLFDVEKADPRCHFLPSLTVAFLGLATGVRDNDGFVKGDQIIRELSGFGFDEDDIRGACKRLASARLIETPHSHFKELPVATVTAVDELFFRMTSIGAYHIKHWMGSFSFIDAMAIDTPIFEEGDRKLVFDLAASFDIEDRFKRATAFRNYLVQRWEAAAFNCGYFSFPDVLKRNEESFQSVEYVLRRRRRV